MFRFLVPTMLIVQILGLMLLAAPAFADQAIDLGQPPQLWSVATSVGRSNNLYITGDGKDSSSLDFSMAPSLKLSRDYSLSGLLQASQDMKIQDSDFIRANLSLSRSSGVDAIHKRLHVVPRVSFEIPAGKAAQTSSFQGGVSLGSRFIINPDSLFSKRFGLGFDLSLGRNFHEFETAQNGKVNTKYSAGQSFELSWAFTDWMSLTGSVGHYDKLSYQGVARDYLSHAEELGFKLSNRFSLAAGHAWGNPYVATRRANGKDLNFEAQDETNSSVYVQMSFVL